MWESRDLVFFLNSATSITTKEALKNTSTFEVLSTWWDTTIALSTFASSFLMSIFACFGMYFFRNHYKQLNEKFPFLRPFVNCICVIAALSIGWVIEMFGRDSEIQITYFSISVQPIVGRWAFESFIHGWDITSKGLIYVCLIHILGIVCGMLVSQLIIFKVSKIGKNKEYNIQSTFGFTPLKTNLHFGKSAIVWLITGATIPFTGYLVYVRSSGSSIFSPFEAILITLSIVFAMMTLTHKVGYYDGNLIFSLCVASTNIFILKNNKKQFAKNIAITSSLTLAYPFIWGVIYGAVFMS
ncbi:MAG: hypothetical protein K2G48_02655 [Malacoplasma sp.]|nr:hypothetical protein [Malacoplasma sp.]